MEDKSKGKSKDISLKIILIAIGIGIWVIVLQNAGIISTNQNVYVDGGNVNVRGSVEVDNTVRVDGSVDVSGSVSVDNTVDVNLDEINGHSNVFFNNPGRGDNEKYYRIPVAVE